MPHYAFAFHICCALKIVSDFRDCCFIGVLWQEGHLACKPEWWDAGQIRACARYCARYK